ncbi:hypothetical protein BLA23254_07279 [Burkholderia lata]|uniref:Uncharacterized protein n=1 Tax=Burkholderia lata (strain ATCC 17760 / DSM 23089 / LMG 22485 / NCIMB 9086 / R18194 / 383) TaxID=482957 RepID=A0A6P2S5S2_BURL3|nr:hypothetical protein [Burkholderia lata]KAF1038636.1 MAG: hypothetical protein GAK33_01972 [Burkholderia lata]VWC45010.1 hypothetical protein BLA23254_07279 [Burkholderia lata]
MDAENYENRYRAVLEFANGALFNVAELDAWATLNKVPVAFQKLFSSDGLQRDPRHHCVSYEILSNTIASNLVPEGMNPNDAKVQLTAAHDNVEPSNPVSRLRDLVVTRYDRLLLCAVYDGELNLYDTLTYTKIDVSPARLGYCENSDAFLQSARARIVDASQGAATPVSIVATLFIDPVRTHVPVGEIAEMTAQAVHPNGSIVWAAALDYQRQELDAAIRRGEIRGFEPSTMRPLTGQLTSLPLKGAPLANAWVPVEDVQKFASGVGVKITFDFSEVKYEFVPEARVVIANESHWSETELEALCLGVPPIQYRDDCVPEAERGPIRQAILSACRSGKLDAHETRAGNAVYGGKWRIERVSAARWAITNHFDRFPEWLARSCRAEIWKQQDEERRTVGRYTLQEAADALELHTGTTAQDWLVKLEQAVPNDHLPVYRPGEQARYRPKTVRAFYEEAYWDDLNAWLNTNEPRVKFQFAEPVTTATSSQCVAAPGTVNRPAFASSTDDVSWTEQAHTLKQIQEQADLWALRQPARLYGDGFSEEMQKQTTLTRYLQYDTWTPEAAAMLVCGLQAPFIDGQLCTEIPENGAMGLDSCFISGSQDPFHEAKRVLGIWRSQENPPAKVRPLDFIRWCRVRGFDTAWLRSIEEDAVNREKEDMKAALGSGVVVIPSAPLLSAEWLAGHIAFSLVAIPDDERLATIKKEVPAGDGVAHMELLTSDDRRLVHSICGKSLAGCSRAEFEAHRQKFAAAENRPEWSLVGEFRESNEMTKAQARWGEVLLAHKQQIAKWASDDGLPLVTADRIATMDITKGFIRREDVKRYLDRYNLPWCDVQPKVAGVDRSRSANGQPKFVEGDQARNSGPSVITKRSIGTRSNPLKAVIDIAKSSAADQSDIHSVWAAFVKLAQDANRPAPLLGYADAEGVKWDDNGTVKFFTKRNLADRVRRAKAR